jgi:hypothetical protein
MFVILTLHVSLFTPSASTTRNRVLLIELEVQIPMTLTPRIEALPTLGTTAPTTHVILDTEDMLASATQHCVFTSSTFRPDPRPVSLTRIVAADAGVVLPAAVMLDGDDIERRVPMGTLGQWCNRDTVNSWRGGGIGVGRHIALAWIG